MLADMHDIPCVSMLETRTAGVLLVNVVFSVTITIDFLTIVCQMLSSSISILVVVLVTIVVTPSS